MTNFASVPDAPRSNDQDLLDRLAADLRSVNYSVDGVAELIGEEAYAALTRDQVVPALLAARTAQEATGVTDEDGRRALAVVILVFLLGQSVSVEELDAAFRSTGAAGLEAVGLTEYDVDGASVRAALDLRPYSSDAGGDLWVASDVGSHLRPGVLRTDHVLGIGQASLTLAQFATRMPVGRALDLGTGCGIQTFHLLAHAEHVTATDISERALGVTRFNLLLNAGTLAIDPDNLEGRVSLRLGSLLEPVAGETFDQVVSNPPFVITPRHSGEAAADQFTYRDAGMAGDQIVSTLVRQIPSVLAPGGTAQLLGNWEVSHDQSWQQRFAEWVPAEADAWVIQREKLSPSHYAETWLRDAAQNRDGARFAELYRDYLTDFASREVSGIGFGMVWLRNAGAASTLQRFEEITYELEQPIGPHITQAVTRHDWLARRSSLNSVHLLVAEDVTEERHQRPGAEHPGVILLRQGAGFRRTNLLSTELAGFVSACDGDLTAGQIIGALAALLNRSDDDFRNLLQADVRNLVDEGFLVPAELA